MPVYEYECSTEDCEGGEAFSIEHSIKDDARKECPFCGHETLKRLISQTNFVWKCSVPTPKSY